MVLLGPSPQGRGAGIPAWAHPCHSAQDPTAPGHVINRRSYAGPQASCSLWMGFRVTAACFKRGCFLCQHIQIRRWHIKKMQVSGFSCRVRTSGQQHTSDRGSVTRWVPLTGDTSVPVGPLGWLSFAAQDFVPFVP